MSFFLPAAILLGRVLFGACESWMKGFLFQFSSYYKHTTASERHQASRASALIAPRWDVCTHLPLISVLRGARDAVRRDWHVKSGACSHPVQSSTAFTSFAPHLSHSTVIEFRNSPVHLLATKVGSFLVGELNQSIAFRLASRLFLKERDVTDNSKLQTQAF